MELNFMTFEDFRINAVMEDFDPVIENFLNRKEFMLLHATAKTGKSMLALNIGLAIATGSDFLGMPTTKSKVLYLQTEIANYALKDRIEQMLEGESIKNYEDVKLNLLISSNRVRVDEVEGISLIKKEIFKYEPNLLIIDPFYELHRRNEDNASEMGPVLSDIRAIARECSCAIILIHHQGKKGETNGGNAGHSCRGSSSFADVPDCSISLSKDKNGYNLRGIFRNRIHLEDLKLKFNEDTLKFELADFVEKPAKTRDLIIEALSKNTNGITLKEIHEVVKIKNNVSISAVKKQVEEMTNKNIVYRESIFKNSKIRLVEEGGISPP